MNVIKNFSISSKRDTFILDLTCSSHRGREKMMKLTLPLPLMESLILNLQKAVNKHKNEISGSEELRYIG